MSEWLDVVDAEDRVVGRGRRPDIHARGLRHRAVHILVFNGRGELFLQRRSAHKDVNPGLWDSSAGGHLEAGEDYREAALRELEEELGIRPTAAPSALFRLDATEDRGWEFCQVYRVEHEGPVRPNPAEVAGGGWFSPADLDAWLARPDASELTSTFRAIWRRLRAA